jgi:hypothetical protein
VKVNVSHVGDNSFNAATEVVVNFAVKEVLSLEKACQESTFIRAQPVIL